MPGSLVALAVGVLLLPAATVFFARMFWNDRWADRVKTTSLAAAWGVAQLSWFVGALIILPAWYLRSAYEAAPPGWALLIPFLASTGALFLFSRGSFKKAALILASRDQRGVAKEKKRPVVLLIEAALVFGGSACAITLVLWKCGKVENWNDLGRLLPFYSIIAACALVYAVSFVLKNKKER